MNRVKQNSTIFLDGLLSLTVCSANLFVDNYDIYWNERKNEAKSKEQKFGIQRLCCPKDYTKNYQRTRAESSAQFVE